MPGLRMYKSSYYSNIGANEPIRAGTINIGCLRGRGSTTRMFAWCKQHSPNPSLCINEFVTIKNTNTSNVCNLLPSDTPYKLCSPWPQFGGLYNSNSRYTPILSSQSGNILWQSQSGDKIMILSSSPIISNDGSIYIVAGNVSSSDLETTTDSFITSFSSNGSINWGLGFDIGDINYQSSPVIGPDGTIYVLTFNDTANSCYLYAITQTGALKWKTPLNCYSSSSIQIYNNNIFICGYNTNTITGLIFALDFYGNIVSGYPHDLITNNPTSSIIDGPAISSTGQLYVCALDNNQVAILYSFNTINQTKSWVLDVTNGFATSRPALSNDESVVYFTYYSNSSAAANYLYAVNFTTGSPIWQYSTRNFNSEYETFPQDSMAIASDGTIYIVVNGYDDNTNQNSYGKLIAVNSNGQEKWRFVFGKKSDNSTSSFVDCSPIVGGDGTIYVGVSVYNNPNQNNATQINLTTFAITSQGQLKWQKITTTTATSSGIPNITYLTSPSIGLNGTIYIGAYSYNDNTSSSNSIVYAIN
jgi:outer membrane protein assembly factor BamB